MEIDDIRNPDKEIMNESPTISESNILHPIDFVASLVIIYLADARRFLELLLLATSADDPPLVGWNTCQTLRTEESVSSGEDESERSF